MSNERIWHDGPPPHIGWWQASFNKNPAYWRWWDGEKWTNAAHESDKASYAASVVSAKYRVAHGCVRWTYYWPKNARVPRIDPRKPTKLKPSSSIKVFQVGEAVRITEAHIEKMKASNRSSANPGYPSSAFINKAKECVGTVGQITHTFPPTHEYTVRFDINADFSISLHMRSSWFEPAS